MCGIAAFLPTPERRGDANTALALLQATLLTLEARGRDSTGVAVVLADGSTDILKLPETARVFLLSPQFREWFARVAARDPLSWLMHTRAATQGEVSLVNAHPFCVGGITSVHNGHVSNYNDIKTQFKLTSECDSEAVAAALAESPVTDYAQGTRKLSGSFALIAHDRRLARDLWVARNSNPLGVVRAGERGVLLSSTSLDPLLRRLIPDDVAVTLTQNTAWKTVPANKQYRISLDTLKYIECGAFETRAAPVVIYSVPSHRESWKEQIMPPMPVDLISLRNYKSGLENSPPPTATQLYDFSRYVRRGLGFSKAYVEKHHKALLYFYLRGTRITPPKGEPVNGPTAYTYTVIKNFCMYTHKEEARTNSWKQTQRLLPHTAGAGSEAAVDPLRRGREAENREAWYDDEIYRGRWSD